MAAIAKLTVFAFDCADPQALADFYGKITGWEVDPDHVDWDWVQLRSDGGATLAFQLAPDHQPPVWPSDEHPQQAHLDFSVDDLDAGEAAVIAVGARKADVQPEPDAFRVYLDPAGHPFCLVLADSRLGQGSRPTWASASRINRSWPPVISRRTCSLISLFGRVPTEIECFLRRLTVARDRHHEGQADRVMSRVVEAADVGIGEVFDHRERERPQVGSEAAQRARGPSRDAGAMRRGHARRRARGLSRPCG